MPDEVKRGLFGKALWTNDELEEVDGLLEACNAHEHLCMKLAMATLRVRSDPAINGFLYYIDGKLVGLLALDSMGSADKEVTLMVHPHYRREGIATKLLRAATQEARRRGIESFILVCERFSPSGQAFVAARRAAYDYSEHKMELLDLQLREVQNERLQLRVAGLADIEDIAHILAECFGQSERGAVRHVSEVMQDPNYHYYIGRLDNQAVGCLNLFTDDKEIGIYALGVMPANRRRGYGRSMLEQIVTRARHEYPEKRIVLEVESENRQAIDLYHACGFREITTYGYYNLDLRDSEKR